MTTLPGHGVIPVFTVADRLRKARELTGLDQGAFAGELGVSRQTVSNAETGARSPQRLTLRAWAMRTGVPLVWLETGQAPSPDPECPRQDSNLQPTVVRLRTRAIAA